MSMFTEKIEATKRGQINTNFCPFCGSKEIIKSKYDYSIKCIDCTKRFEVEE